ncbi:hypothetical protein GTY79_00125, partial [Streptomyces sp. SID8385]|nr:hypothetical protein [Streptomyces sp. SID8385]
MHAPGRGAGAPAALGPWSRTPPGRRESARTRWSGAMGGSGRSGGGARDGGRGGAGPE